MSADEPDKESSGAPIMDQETYELAQELFQLVRVGADVPRLAKLLEMGLAPNIRDGKGDSLLMLASYHGHHEMTRLLLEHGGDPQLANDRGQIPLAGAAFKGDTAIARLLIEHCAQVNARTPDGKTPLMFAAMFNRTEIIDLLLAHGADPALQTDEGVTALGLAQAMGAQAAAARLVQAAN
ncbi:MAG: ankyrin repeat domain-containing protein [Hyphomicrobiales bacterium]|nr:MAG: ankyrin repeat domain-containing protein [Hyphomicrobiales bacterium]